MIKRIITHIKRWNKWRKRCVNGWLYKFLVLFGMYSPTFNITLTDEELEELEQAFIKAMKDTPVQILKDDYYESDKGASG